MKTALAPLIDRKIGIFLHHNQFAEGVLLAIKQDHLVVQIDGEIYYFTVEHIPAFTGNINHAQTSQKEVIPHHSNDLMGVLTHLQNKWVTINRFSDQVFSGILSSIQEDHIVVTNDQALHYIAISSIANIHQESKLTRTLMTERSSEMNKEITTEEPLLRLITVIKQLIINSKEDVQRPLPKEKPSIRRYEKRTLLTPWSEMNYDQNAIAIPATSRKKSPPIPILPVEKNEILLDEKPPIANKKRFEEQTVEAFINPKERKAMVEKQYYALMRHAEQNQDQKQEDTKKIPIHASRKDEKVVVEKQFHSLMRHAAKMYRQLRD